MEVDDEVVLGTHLGGAAVEVDGQLVVAIHEINLEAFDAHLAIMLADVLHIAVKGIVACPEDDADVALFGIVDEHGQVYLGYYLEEVGLPIYRPALVEDDVLYAIL